MNFKFQEKNWRGLKGTTCGTHGPVKHIVKNGVPVDFVVETTAGVLKAGILRDKASQSELRVAPALFDRGFEHSVPMFGYFLDFYNPYLKICIEIDGPYHDKPERRDHDKQRDAVMRAHAIRTWRFKAHWARGNPESLINYIDKLIKRMVPDEFVD